MAPKKNAKQQQTRHDSRREMVRREDSWASSITGIGMANRDKRKSNQLVASRTVYEVDVELYRSDDMAARAVDAIADEMTREWVDVQIEGEKGMQEDVEGWMEEMGVQHKFNEALKWKRAYGGGAIVLGIDDGQADLTKPLNENAIKSLTFLTTLTSREVPAVEYYNDPTAAKLGEPKVFRIQPIISDALEVKSGKGKGDPFPLMHESRVLQFQGIYASRRQLRERQGWGDPIFVRMQEVLQDFQVSWAAASHLLQDFAQAVLRVKGLAEMILADNDKAVIKRAELIDMSRSVARMVLLDEEEEFERKATPLTGLPEMMDKLALRLAAAVPMPVTMLMGQSPAGLQATGESDIRWFYDKIAAGQRTDMKPQLKRLLKLAFLSADGPTGGKEPKNWSIRFRRLWQLDDLQQADLRLKQSQTDAAYVNAGVLDPDEVAESRFGGDEYSTDTQLDLEARAAMAKAQAEMPPPPPPPVPGQPGGIPNVQTSVGAPVPGAAPAPGGPAPGTPPPPAAQPGAGQGA